jgi:hypothetical protein
MHSHMHATSMPQHGAQTHAHALALLPHSPVRACIRPAGRGRLLGELQPPPAKEACGMTHRSGSHSSVASCCTSVASRCFRGATRLADAPAPPRACSCSTASPTAHAHRSRPSRSARRSDIGAGATNLLTSTMLLLDQRRLDRTRPQRRLRGPSVLWRWTRSPAGEFLVIIIIGSRLPRRRVLALFARFAGTLTPRSRQRDCAFPHPRRTHSAGCGGRVGRRSE